ncbi:tyrosine--tRNA ligase [Lutibaculum baratangense]|uniref:Tyrosine--tRNA ligase n=1 Tax=Lutibaculum baratangense AMV1 TaxID=631454 RepID=V4QZA6_9HYPH|nr:tyrosine--tRNA ligase [Lutibaculum baratangense]ESR25087.1 Tyrosyl-tRNA synthetase [Lutibaculum baratangense AMV1]
MSGFKSEFLKLLDERGYIHQASDLQGLDELLSKETVTAYIGFDPTGKSLHVGHMMGIMMLKRLQQAGHKPVVLIGGGTSRIGDPSGKDEQRQLLTDEDIAANMASIRSSFERYLAFGDGPADAVMVNNADWLDELRYIPLLRDVGRHFSVNRMLSFDSVRLRLEREQPLSFLEFNYMILQAYDFVELSKRLGVRLQMGGSDQWGNIINGIELGRRMAGIELFGLTCPLITTASGAKMGKTAAGAVWLNEDMLSSWDYWQFWRNTEDADVGRFLKLFTDLPMEEIARLEALKGSEINEAKKVLATEATAILHGRKAAEEAAETARRTFEEHAFASALPTVEVPAQELEEGMGVLAAFVRAGLCASNGEARRAVTNGAVKVNDRSVSDPHLVLGITDVTSEGVIKLSFGRKKHALLKPR